MYHGVSRRPGRDLAQPAYTPHVRLPPGIDVRPATRAGLAIAAGIAAGFGVAQGVFAAFDIANNDRFVFDAIAAMLAAIAAGLLSLVAVPVAIGLFGGLRPWPRWAAFGIVVCAVLGSVAASAFAELLLGVNPTLWGVGGYLGGAGLAIAQCCRDWGNGAKPRGNGTR